MNNKELARKIHKSEHLFVNGKYPKDHKIEEYYYLLGAMVINEIRKSNLELFNIIVDLEIRFNKIEESMKEVSKQQKYLWQTLEEKEEKE